jgi:hypothetical protein
MQQSAFLQLLLSGVVLFLVLMAAAWFLVIPRGVRSRWAVAPVLTEFMKAGAKQDALAGHILLSDRGIRTYSPKDVAALFAQRTYFQGFSGLRVRTMRMVPRRSESEPEAADVTATVNYASAQPATLTARLELQEGDWRIASVAVNRPPPTPAASP